jgi:tRNA A-37 threonylcarbamoyl transferase component Bud32
MMRTDPADANDRTTVQLRDPLVGTVLDQRFRIDFQLAAGGFGAIYQATDVHSSAEVALKVLHPKLARDPNVIERFRREAATLSNLRNPHTIRAYEFGEAPDGTLHIVMELLHGESLYQQYHAKGPLPWRRVVHIARGVCSSLAEAHAYGIVHRDLKPANIHLESHGGDDDFVKVLDFGIAKIVHGAGQERTELTQAGQMIGTVDYMSPEQMVGGEMTGRSDIYTLGTLMYEMISGRMPFADAQTATAILAAVLTRTPEPLSHHTPVPPALDEIVARCLARDPQKRYAEIGELDDALAKVAAMGQRPSAPARVDLADRPTTAYARQAPVEAAGMVETTDVMTRAPARPSPVVQGTIAVASSGFEEASPTSEATRIDVRFTESSQPVLDARGPRYRMPEVFVPPAVAAPAVVAPAATPHAHPAATPHAHPAGTPHAHPAATPHAHAAGTPHAHPAAAPQAPSPAGTPVGAAIAAHHAPGQARGSHHAIEARGWQPQPGSRGSLPMIAAGPQPPVAPAIPPPLRASNYPPRSYDMAAMTSHDAIVRRIIWISVIAAIVIAIIIATH